MVGGAGKERSDRRNTNYGIPFSLLGFRIRSCVRRLICALLLRDRDQFLASADRRKRGFNGEDAVLAQRRLDAFRVGALWQQELPVVFPVDRFALRLLLMFRMDQQLVIHGLDNDLLRRVLGDVESKLEHFAIAFVLDEGAV